MINSQDRLRPNGEAATGLPYGKQRESFFSDCPFSVSGRLHMEVCMRGEGWGWARGRKLLASGVSKRSVGAGIDWLLQPRRPDVFACAC